jgi:hypothetical protein
MCSTKAPINRMGLSAEIVSSKDAMVIWLREFSDMLHVLKYEIRCFMRITFIFGGI